MSKKQQTGVWVIAGIASVIAMFVSNELFHWEEAWLCPIIGGCTALAITFFFARNDEEA